MADSKARADWTDRELISSLHSTVTTEANRAQLVYILSAMEHSNVKLDYTNAPVPVGRNASGCSQRVNRLKKSLKNDMDALKNGMPVSDTKVKGKDIKGKNKRKAEDGEDGEVDMPKKRRRAKKVDEPEAEVKQEATPDTEGMGEEEQV